MRSLLQAVVFACLVAGGIVCPCVEAADALAQHADAADTTHHSAHHGGKHAAGGPEPDRAGIEGEHCCDLPAVVPASPGDDPDDSTATIPPPRLDPVLELDRTAALHEPPAGRPPDSPVALRDRLLE